LTVCIFSDGIFESTCGFDPSELCGYKIITPNICPTEETYRWTVYNENGGKFSEKDVKLC
jgi:hypothetical protein